MRRSVVSILAPGFGILALIGVCPRTFAQTVISVDAQSNRHVISPNIYGVAWASTAQLSDLNASLNRMGGNSTSRYNWRLNADNRANDWYFESIGDASAVEGERADTFIGDSKSAGAMPLLTIPLLPYIAKLAPNRDYLWSFSRSKYGNQSAYDPWRNDAGNGMNPNGQPITGNNPLDANVANSVATQSDFVKHLLAKWGNSGAGGVRYYVMDNEPAIWHATHRDVHPLGQTMDELYNLYSSYGGAIKAADPGALIVGPEEWGWTGYLYSGYDSQWASTHGWSSFPDREAHGNLDHMAWFLQKMKSHEVSTGKRLLDVFSLHYYPQGGEFWGDSPDIQALRNRSTRSLWDPNYTDESWIGDKVKLIPRMKAWVNTYYPGLPIAITEYNWGSEGTMSGATAQADIYGIFGREGLDMATRWTTPATATPTYLAMKMYRNYDNAKSGFGDTSVGCAVPNPDNLSAFAAQRSSDGALTVMVINKVTSAANIRVDLAGFTPGLRAEVWQVASASQTAIDHLGDAIVSSGAVSMSVPAQSVTLLVIPKAGDAPPVGYDFEKNTQGWQTSGAPITSLTTFKGMAATGQRSLAVGFGGKAGRSLVFVNTPSVTAGKTVKYRVWIPASAPITSVQPFVMQGAAGNWTWTGNWRSISQLVKGAWNTLSVTVPANAATPLAQLGFEFTTKTPWTGTVYVDGINW